MRFERFGFLSAATIAASTILLIAVNSCKHDEAPADQMAQVCFQEQVLPIFQNSCATSGCHSGTHGAGGYVFTDYASIMKAINPGNADKSAAYEAITSKFQVMPPGNALPKDKRTLIRLWIEQGAENSSCTSPVSGIGDPDTVSVNQKSGTLWACYGRDVQPILMSSCAVSGCHDAGTRREGINFADYNSTMKTLKPGNPASSELYAAITAKQGTEHFMPPKPYSPLTKAAIDSIYSWIKRGALNEECASPCDTTGTITYQANIKSIIDLSCASCHGTSNPSGGITLTSLTELKKVAASGKLMGAVKRQAGFHPMPPTYALNSCEVNQIALWIKQGTN